jgi:RNA polymerase sigma factor (sigma-70 family)
LHHKIDQDDLVSDLYLKLARTNIPRLPENRRQFFGLVDKAILGILLDMQKALARRPRTAKNELLDVHPDQRTAQDQLGVLLESEEAEREVAMRLELERLLAKLPEVQQEVFKLRRNGVEIAEIVEITGVSRATIGRYIRDTKTYLANTLGSQSPK